MADRTPCTALRSCGKRGKDREGFGLLQRERKVVRVTAIVRCDRLVSRERSDVVGRSGDVCAEIGASLNFVGNAYFVKVEVEIKISCGYYFCAIP